MIAASSLAFPGSKTLAGWWRDLASFHPQALWVGHLLLHRLEALAEILQIQPTDSLTRLLLKALALEPSRGADWLTRLDKKLHLGPAVIRRLLQDLHHEGLLQEQAEFQLTSLGQEALEKGSFPRRFWQRCEFAFLERTHPDGKRLAQPHFLPLQGGVGLPWQPGEEAHFEITELLGCLTQPRDWRELFHFPAEVLAVADPQVEADAIPPAWQRVVVDNPERLLLVLVADETRLLGFAARQEGWELQAQQPILTLPLAAREIFPDLVQTPSPEAWQRAWHIWCAARRLPLAQVQQCLLHPKGWQLEVEVPRALEHQLTSGKSDFSRSETWLLAGEGYLRTAAQLLLKVLPEGQ